MASFRYKKCVVIVHGKSELCLVKYIYTNLHLSVEIVSRENGNSSIQINGLRRMLSKKPYTNLKTFSNHFMVEYDKQRKSLKNFSLFIIMDTDDCTEATRDDYISGKLFQGLALAPYIVPIYNITKLEDVLHKTKIMPKKIAEKEKGKFYSTIFPINRGPLSNETVEQVRYLLNELDGLKETNLPIMIKHFLQLAEEQKHS